MHFYNRAERALWPHFALIERLGGGERGEKMNRNNNCLESFSCQYSPNEATCQVLVGSCGTECLSETLRAIIFQKKMGVMEETGAISVYHASEHNGEEDSSPDAS